jgi:hypothetical protein
MNLIVGICKFRICECGICEFVLKELGRMRAQSRRTIIKYLATGISIFSFSRILYAFASVVKKIDPPAGQIPVSESDAVASAIGYHQNVKDIDFKKYPQRKAIEAQNQLCKACENYTFVNQSWGKCQILNGLVASEGWCSSWTAKAPLAK